MKTRIFKDFDEFSHSIRDIADSRMLMRNARNRMWSIESVDFNGIDVQIGKLGSGNIAQGTLRSDGHMLYLPLTDNVQYTGNGVTIERDSCAILEPGSEFCISTKLAHDWCAVFIPNNALSKLFQDWESPHRLKSGTCRVSSNNSHATRHIRTMVAEIMNAAALHESFSSTPAAATAAANLIEVGTRMIGIAQIENSDRQGRPKISRDQIVRNCMDTLDDRGIGPVSLSDLTSAANVSERTLRTVFREYFGVGPTRFLIIRQLNLVHAALKKADHEHQSVGQILMDHGEYAFSRFASRYKRMFGELPSETLRTDSQ